MAAVSLSPSPVSLSTMSGRRVPLSQNQNVANSPLRASHGIKQKRSVAALQREEVYAQPPPAKKQILESGIPRPSPSQQHHVSRSQASTQLRRNNVNTYENKVARERGSHQQRVESNQQVVYHGGNLEVWKEHYRAKFPKFVFYFDSIPDDIRMKLAKQIHALGAREEKFFSIAITHVVTSRSIPANPKSEKGGDGEQENEKQQENKRVENKEQEQVRTIDPSLLDRTPQHTPQHNVSVRRTLFTTSTAKPSNTTLTQIQDAKPKRNTDVLYRARDMEMKIWSLDKLHRMVVILLEKSQQEKSQASNGKASEEPSLMQLLHNERVKGPSDRDPTDLHYFKGPYIYVYDFEEKHRPIMVREYEKVQDKADGDWPQFRSAAQGRCPFIEDYDHREVVKPKPKAQAVKPAISKSVLQPPRAASAKPVTGKRSLGEMESSHTRGSSVASTEFMNPPKPVLAKTFDFRPNAFTSRTAAGKLFGGEPVASGVQPSNVTSAIRSQMISSTAATPGAIGVLSKEVHGLQRQVLKRNSSHDVGSRRTGSVDTSLRDDSQSKRSLTLGRTSSRKLELIDEVAVDEETASRAQAAKQPVVKPKKRDPKPGYCENCQDKFDDFDDHIMTRKHRRFAENQNNWAELDDLLSQLERAPKNKSFSTWTPTLPRFPVY